MKGITNANNIAKSEVDSKQPLLVSGQNIKTINGDTILGAGNLAVETYQPFPNSWRTNSTIENLMADITADTSAVVGMAYLGEVRCTNMPFSGNAELIVNIMNGSGNSKVIWSTLSSGNVSPYYWHYTYWNSHGSGWRSYIPSDQAGNFVDLSSAQTLTGEKTWEGESLDYEYGVTINPETVSATTTSKQDNSTMTTYMSPDGIQIYSEENDGSSKTVAMMADANFYVEDNDGVTPVGSNVELRATGNDEQFAYVSELPTGFTNNEMENICLDILYPALPAPTNVTASGTTLSFDEVQGATNYNVYANGDIIGEYAPTPVQETITIHYGMQCESAVTMTQNATEYTGSVTLNQWEGVYLQKSDGTRIWYDNTTITGDVTAENVYDTDWTNNLYHEQDQTFWRTFDGGNYTFIYNTVNNTLQIRYN